MLKSLTRVAGSLFRPRQKALPNSSYSSGYIPPSWPWNFWQMGLDPLPNRASAVVYACRSAYSQTISMCPGMHWLSTGDGGRERVTTSALSRILQRPNSYQSAADFFLYLTDCLYGAGSAFGLALRNARFEIAEIHLFDPTQCGVSVTSTTGDLFYQLAGNQIVEGMFADRRGLLSAVPARDVLHIRLPDPRNPLVGVPPLEAALLEVQASDAMVKQALAYTANQGRPSGVLSVPPGPHPVSPEEIAYLRQQWDAQTKGPNAGGTPIVTNGMIWTPANVNSRDAQLAEILHLADTRIATAYRIPPPLLSLDGAAGPQGSTEAVMQLWFATGAGFCANLLEDGFGRLFGLKGYPDEYVELDFSALLRASQKDRIEALARGVQGGIYAPNEARALEDLPAAKDGDEPRVQQQVVPLSAWSDPPPATPRPDAPAAPPPAGDAPAAPTDAEKQAQNDRVIRSYRSANRLAA
jgi:HK97 family phage portal protein